MTRKRWTLVGAAVLVAAIATGGVVLIGGESATSAAKVVAPSTATVERGSIADKVSLDGILTYRARPDGSPYSVVNQARGIYTALPEVGDRVDCGDVLFRVDDEPVLLLCGAVPAYRDLRLGDAGRDVRQLNRSLHRFGADPDSDVFTWKTQAALEELQRDKGMDVTGALSSGGAVFLPRPVRIARVTGRLGGSARLGDLVAQATTAGLEVQVSLDATRQDEVKVGQRALITVPGNRFVKGKVTRLGRVAQLVGKDDNEGDARIPAYLTIRDPRQVSGLDRAPVRVDITTTGVKGVLSVPVTALVGRSGGGFAVEKVRKGGQRALVPVRLGLFDTTAGRVEVQGNLRTGDHVVVPSP